MPDKTPLLPPPSDRPFALTDEKFSAECARGEVKGSNFPYREVQSLLGYSERNTPGLSASGVTDELARYLHNFAKQQGRPLPATRDHISRYLWVQASRGMLPWEEILRAVRVARRKDLCRPIAHYFGYSQMLEPGTRKKGELLKWVRYIAQEGVCAGCSAEFPYSDLEKDRRKPGREQGNYVWSNVQLLCRPCHERKDNYGQTAKLQ